LLGEVGSETWFRTMFRFTLLDHKSQKPMRQKNTIADLPGSYNAIVVHFYNSG